MKQNEESTKDPKSAHRWDITRLIGLALAYTVSIVVVEYIIARLYTGGWI